MGRDRSLGAGAGHNSEGCPDSRHVAEVVKRFPELVVHQDYPTASIPGQLVSYLNQCLVAGTFPKGKRGRIDRRHIADRLQTPVENIRRHKDILASYDAVLPRLQPVDEIAGQVTNRFPVLAPHQLHPVESTKGRLVKMLNECVVAGSIPRSAGRFNISRRHFAHRLDLSPSVMATHKDIFVSYEGILEEVEPFETIERPAFRANPETSEPMDENALEVVSRYPDLLKHQHYPVGHKAQTIVQILNAQLCGEGLVRSRGGKIDRRLFHETLGVTKSALTSYIPIFTDYEDAAGLKEARVELLLPSIREWLDEAFSDGSLQLRDGKVSRVQLYEQFGLPKTKTNFIRYPRLGDLVEEFDAKVASSGYQPKEVLKKAKELEELLRVLVCPLKSGPP